MAPAKQLSKETVATSDMEQDSSDASSSSSSSDSESEATPPAQGPPSAMKRKSNGVVNTSPSKRVKFTKETESTSESQESEEEEESEESVEGEDDKDGESDDEDDDGDSQAVSSPLQTRGHQSNGTTSPATLHDTPATSYTAPPGFAPVPADARDRATASLLEPSYLSGKQLFLISAPAHVPIKSLKSLPMAESLEGVTVLTHQGDDYTLVKSQGGSTLSQVLTSAPGKDGLVYKQCAVKIQQRLQLRQAVSLPTALGEQAGGDDGADVHVNVHDVRPVVPQPEGLRTRWWPMGFEEAPAEKTAGGAHQAVKKRSKKRDTGDIAAVTNGDEKKKKKKKKQQGEKSVEA